MTDEPMRLQKFLARGGVASRRASEKLILEGRVSVNGQVVVELGTRVDPSTDEVKVDGKLVALGRDSVVLMLHKPAGYLTSMKDDRGRPCVAQLVPVRDVSRVVFPLADSILIRRDFCFFTTDGELGNALLHPSFHVIGISRNG